MVSVVSRGEKISGYMMRHQRCFPPIVGHMVAVGERSGTLSDTLVYLSELYEHEVDEFTKNLSTLVEPALMVVMGIIVGFIAVSIITPIYGITQNLHP
jgi:type II secretory pathway component PulF